MQAFDHLLSCYRICSSIRLKRNIAIEKAFKALNQIKLTVLTTVFVQATGDTHFS